VNLEEYEAKVRALAQERGAKRAEREKEKGKAFAVAEGKKPGATTTPSGLIFRETKGGTGASPAATDKVKVHYRGAFIDGKEFDSSKPEDPVQFGLNQVIPCWTEGVQKMKIGGKANLVCPSDIAYGDRGRPGIPPGATLVFDIELLEIVK
jgi:FKBP-type peptidyl-prolyl cis-trans isomerase FkpA